MIHVVNVSGGMASAVCLFRVIERFGRDSVRAVFADTNSEDADLYRFLDDVERVAGVTIDRLNDGRNIWDCFHHTEFFVLLNNGCKASWELKKKPLAAYHAAIGQPYTIYVGFGADEQARQNNLTSKLTPQPVEYPLTWQPTLLRCDLADDLRGRGIEPPRLYALGYPHNNCAGGCILAGVEQWAGLLRDNPELFAYHEAEEQKLIAAIAAAGRPVMTILRNRRGGTTTSLSLRQLREEIESGERVPRDSWRAATCSCMGSLFG